MAPNIRVPEGYVFVPRVRGENVALQLIEAADSVKANRHESVRTVSGGYHVRQDVAEAYGIERPEVDDETVAAAETAAGVGGETGEVTATVGETPDSTPAETPEEKAAREEAQGHPDGDPTGDWTVKQLEAWADSRDPKVDLGSGDKASKVQAALDSLKS